MPRQKKDAIKVCMNIDVELWERVKAHAEEKGQTLTTAVERLLSKALDEDCKGD